VTWANAEQDIVLQYYHDCFTLDDYFQVVEQSAALLNSVNCAVDLIIMLPDKGEYNLKTAVRANEVEQKVPPNQRFVVVVNAPAAIKLLIDAARVVAPRATANLHHVNTLTQAFDRIRHLRTT